MGIMMIAGTECRRQGCSLQDGKQWGYSGYAVNFPISFGIVYNVLSIPQNTASTSNSYWGRFYITNLTKNGFTVSDTGAGSNRWLAIGKAQPQWGNLWAGYTEVLNWYFPLTTSQVYAVCLTKHTKNISSGHNWEPARIEEWNNSYARIHPDGDLGYSVIAICKAQQQWGHCSSRTATFPIPFPASALFIVAVPKTTSTSATATGAEYLGTTSVNLYLHGTSGWYFVGGH